MHNKSSIWTLTIVSLLGIVSFGVAQNQGPHTFVNVDLGFRYVQGKCVNPKGDVGLNPQFFGQCGDFAGLAIGGFNLTNIDFSGSNFRSADLRKSDLSRANLTGADMQSCNLSGVISNETNFSNADLTKAVLHKITAGDALFNSTILMGADLKEANLSYADFTKANLQGAMLTDATLNETTLALANLNEANLEHSVIINSKAAGVTANESKWVGVRIEDTDLSGLTADKAQFTDARMRNVNLSSAVFTKANLERSVLDKVSLKNSKLMEAFLKRSTLKDSDLTSADLSKSTVNFTDFTGTEFNGAKWTAATFNKMTKFKYTIDEAKALGMVFIVREGLTLFYNPAYVNVGDGSDGTAKNLKTRYEKMDNFSTFSDITLASFEDVFNEKSLVIFPFLDKGDLGANISKEVGKAIKAYVADGGNIIIQSSTVKNNRFDKMMLSAFGITTKEMDSNSDDGIVFDKKNLDSSVLKGFPLTKLENVDALYCLPTVDAPGVKIASNENGCAGVALFPIGKGTVLYIGYDTYDFVPVGDQDGGWASFLDFAIKALQ